MHLPLMGGCVKTINYLAKTVVNQRNRYNPAQIGPSFVRMERTWDQRRSSETLAPLTSRLPNMESLRVRYDRWKMSADRPLCTRVQRQQQSAHGIAGSSIIKTVFLVYLSGCPCCGRVPKFQPLHVQTTGLHPWRGVQPRFGVVQSDRSRSPVQPPSGSRKVPLQRTTPILDRTPFEFERVRSRIGAKLVIWVFHASGH